MNPETNRRTGGRESLGAVFAILKHPTRRRILLELQWGDEVDPTEFVRISELHHLHIPKMEEPEWIDWNERKGTIRRGPNYGEIEPLMELLLDNQDQLPGRL